MIGNREEIIRLNIERFQQLLVSETDPQKRRMLGNLLSEARAELEFLADVGSLQHEQVAGPVSEARMRRLRRKANECRSTAQEHQNSSTGEFFRLLAERYDTILKRVEDSGSSDSQ